MSKSLRAFCRAICSCGLKSKEFVSTGTVNTKIYVEECLKRRLLPFLKDHGCSTFFWPDHATCHYGKEALEFYRNNNITVVTKEANTPNCPQLRPTEKYWVHMKRKLKKTKSKATNEKDFRSKWRKQAKNIDETAVQRLMGGLKSKVLQFWIEK